MVEMEKGMLLGSLILGINIIRSVNCLCTLFDSARALNCSGLPQELLHMADADYAQMRQEVCQPGRSLGVAECLESVRNSGDCAGDEGFESFVKTDVYLEFIEYFCNQSEGYDDDAGCIGQAYEGAPTCSADELMRVGSLMEQGLLTTFLEMMTEMCSYLKVDTQCHVDLIESQCSTEAVQFAATLYMKQFGNCYTTTNISSTTASARPTTRLTTDIEETTEPSQQETEQTTQTTDDPQTDPIDKAGVLKSPITLLLLPVILTRQSYMY